MPVALWGRRSARGKGGAAPCAVAAVTASLLLMPVLPLMSVLSGAPAQAQSYRPASGQPDYASADELYQDAQDNRDKGNLGAAVRPLEELLERYPDSSRAIQARRDLVVLYGKLKERLMRRQQDAQKPSMTPKSARRSAAGKKAGRAGALRGKLRIAARRPASPKVNHNDAFKLAMADRVFFGQDSTGLGGLAHDVIYDHAKWLKAHPRLTIILNGYADENGTDAFNTKISRLRAEAVRNLLIKQGIARDRIKIVAHGRADPVAPCHTVGCAAQNRRVVADVALQPPRAGKVPEVATVDRQNVPASVPVPVQVKRR